VRGHILQLVYSYLQSIPPHIGKSRVLFFGCWDTLYKDLFAPQRCYTGYFVLSVQLLSQVGVTVGLHYSITIGNFFDISNFRHAQVLDRQGGYKQSIPAACWTDIIKPRYPGLEAVKPGNPGLKNTPRVCIP